MAFKLKTSKKTEEILTQIESSVNIPYATLVKLSLALSLRKGPLAEDDFKTNNLGRELNRQTITGDADPLYKCLFEVCANRHVRMRNTFRARSKRTWIAGLSFFKTS